jgi:hypothetical protein
MILKFSNDSLFVSWQSLYIRRKLLKVYILFNCANKIFSSYGTSLHGKTVAGYLSFPFIIYLNRDGFYFL